MKLDLIRMMGIVTVVGVLVAAGCRQKTPSESSSAVGVGERTGAALDTAAANTADAAKSAAVATKDAAGRVVEKTGDVMQKAGAATEDTGANMQK